MSKDKRFVKLHKNDFGRIWAVNVGPQPGEEGFSHLNLLGWRHDDISSGEEAFSGLMTQSTFENAIFRADYAEALAFAKRWNSAPAVKTERRTKHGRKFTTARPILLTLTAAAL